MAATLLDRAPHAPSRRARSTAVRPLLSHTLFPIHVAALVWGGPYLRDARVRALLRPSR